MNIENLKTRGSCIYDDMLKYGFKHEKAINIKHLTERLIFLYENSTVRDYEEFYRYLVENASYKSKSTCDNIKRRIGLIRAYVEENRFPTCANRSNFMKKRIGRYFALIPYYKNVVDEFRFIVKDLGYSRKYMSTCVSVLSNFLFYLQTNHCCDFTEVEEYRVREFFYKDGVNLKSASYRNYLYTVLSICKNKFDDLSRVISYLPELRIHRKNKQYLTESEVNKLKLVISEESNLLSLRDKAILSIAFYTGLRGCDIVGMTYNNIDWERNTINLMQSKTGKEILLPMRPIVGNALYEYITNERPHSNDPHIFLAYGREIHPLQNGSVRNILVKAMLKSGIRQNGGQKGFHLLRHNLATTLLKNEISTAVITETLGHSALTSTNIYLSSEMTHLKDFALSIEDYPIGKEVFNL